MKISVIIAALVVSMLIPVFSMAENVVLIGNASIKESTLSKKDVRKIFLGKKIAWNDKTKIVIALHKNRATHNAFLKEYINKSPSIYSRLWKRLIFTGKVISPKYLINDREMITYVGETRGAVGYIANDHSLDNVKIISVK